MHSNQSQNDAVDSFDLNLKQIEQTNLLLNNIEFKLNDFFNKSKSYKQKSENNNNINNTPDSVLLLDNKDLPISTIVENFTTEKSDFIPNSTQNSGNSSKGGGYRNQEWEINKGNDKQINGYLETNSANDNQSEANINRYPGFNSKFIDMTNAKSSGLTRSEKAIPSLKSREIKNIKPNITNQAANTYVRSHDKNPQIIRDQKVHYISMPSETASLEEKPKLEKYYTDKIKILEERILLTENEIRTNNKLVEKLEDDNARLKDEINDLKSKHYEDMAKKLKEQECKLKGQFEKEIKHKEKLLQDLHDQNDIFLKQIEGIRLEKKKVMEENENLQKNIKIILEEKDLINQNYQQMLNFHNQIVQLDIQKTEKNFKGNNGGNANHEAIHDKNDILMTFENKKGNKSIKSMDELPIPNDSTNHNQSKNLYETIENYKQELEQLKENNMNITKQFNEELLKLKKELQAQEEYNIKLVEKLQKQNQEFQFLPKGNKPINEKSISMLGNNLGFTEEINKNADLIKVDISKLDMQELTNYAKSIKSLYLDLEEKLKTQSISNQPTKSNFKEFWQGFNSMQAQAYEINSTNTLSGRIPNALISKSPSDDFGYEIPFTNQQIKNNLINNRRLKLKAELQRQLGDFDEQNSVNNDKPQYHFNDAKESAANERKKSCKFSKKSKRSIRDISNQLEQMNNNANSHSKEDLNNNNGIRSNSTNKEKLEKNKSLDYISKELIRLNQIANIHSSSSSVATKIDKENKKPSVKTNSPNENQVKNTKSVTQIKRPISSRSRSQKKNSSKHQIYAC